jgi:ubiquinone/menaquinone biosynthesis C-methylase UbiE
MSHRICPWWLGPLLASPLRRLLYKPEEMLSGYIESGMTVLDVGCGMGFFSLPIAGMVGTTGKVICIDLQEKMIDGLKKRAVKAGVSDRIDARICKTDKLDLEDMSGRVDFVLACALMHEVPDKERLLNEIFRVMKKGGRILISEPSGHVGSKDFEHTVQSASNAGFAEIGRPAMRRSRTVLMIRE